MNQYWIVLPFFIFLIIIIRIRQKKKNDSEKVNKNLQNTKKDNYPSWVNYPFLALFFFSENNSRKPGTNRYYILFVVSSWCFLFLMYSYFTTPLVRLEEMSVTEGEVVSIHLNRRGPKKISILEKDGNIVEVYAYMLKLTKENFLHKNIKIWYLTNEINSNIAEQVYQNNKPIYTYSFKGQEESKNSSAWGIKVSLLFLVLSIIALFLSNRKDIKRIIELKRNIDNS